MSESNPRRLHDALNATLRRYIPTTLPISRRYPELRREVREQVAAQTLVQGPYVEALPDFEKGRPLRALLRGNGGYLHDGFGALPAALLDRPLHRHQEQALELACRDGDNLLVATGTGSGKTECFLYPLVQRLLDDPEPQRPGVRCLLIYPMNALANDQLYYRIAPLFGHLLGAAGISFGRFTSQIRAHTRRFEEESRLRENDRLMTALGGAIPAHWRLTREEMLAAPPKILITNYAMLEHLLLLPRNAPLFAQDALQCIVLDEIHTYSGAQATEVAFLLRKLKNRLGLERRLQVFGTSASLPEGEAAEVCIRRFASELLDEPLQRVVRGRRIVHTALTDPANEPFSLSPRVWTALAPVLDRLAALPEPGVGDWRAEIREAGLPAALADRLSAADRSALAPALVPAFAGNRELRRVAERLDRGGVQTFTQLARDTFAGLPEADDETLCSTALSAVIHLGMLARSGPDAFPLLPARYHLAVNGIEGIAVRLDAQAPEGWAALTVRRTHRDEHGLYYPLLVCRKCGQPYIEGFHDAHSARLHHRRPAGGESKVQRRVFWLGSPPDVRTADESDELDGPEESGTPAGLWTTRRIDPQTGLESAGGSVTLYEITTVEDQEERAHYVQTCPACGGRTGAADAEIVTRMHPGDEALGSVVVQQVLEALPERTDGRRLPMGGRKLLTFSDNRQNAAFFAPYFERTASEQALRTGLCQALKDCHEREDARDLDDLVHAVTKHWRRAGLPLLLDENGRLLESGERFSDLLTGLVAAEFCTPGGRRNSLEALGLVSVQVDPQALDRIARSVQALVPAAQQAGLPGLLDFLLETVRREKAIGGLDGIDMKNAWLWGANYASHRAFALYRDKDRKLHGWLPAEGSRRHNRRTHYLVNQLGWPRDAAIEFLGRVWSELERVKLLVRLPDGGHGLDVHALRFGSALQQPLHVCRRCGLMQLTAIAGRCTAYGCNGETRPLDAGERDALNAENHYITRYLDGGAGTVRAREHTASLSTGLREQIEREFAEGSVNLLSCTTTMEMGVDLGDLEAVVNLDVPPGIANYQQRTGRAGRRAQAAPFCVTVARNAQYDQAMFRDFPDYLGRSAPVPSLLLDNAQLFRRHQLGIVLGGFLRARIARTDKNAPELKDLFADPFDAAACAAFDGTLAHWLEGEDGRSALDEATRLTQRLPDGLQHLGLAGPQLREHARERLLEFAQEVHERWQLYEEKRREAFESAGSTTSKGLAQQQRWVRLAEEYLGQFIVDQCSARSLIPTYSFPVHSLNLEVVREQQQQNYPGQGSDVALSRDASLGISEYAPGAEVVANGRIWTSAALARYPKQFMPEEYYVACPDCHHVDAAIAREDVPARCSHCGSGESHRQVHAYLRPRGFTTSYTERNGKDPGSTRRRSRPADEARLITIPRESQYEATDHPLLRRALLRAQPHEADAGSGRLFIVNRGPHSHGYLHCPWCFHAEPAVSLKPAKRKHDDPLSGKACAYENSLKPVDLAHEFDTDVLLLRCALPLAPKECPELLPRQALEASARTLAEALRFAAAGLLEIQHQELRAVYRLRGARAEFVLYDAVAGGAGYCVRLAQEHTIRELLQAALVRLDCPRDCASACTACLCDYSNQMHWDALDRHAVRDWLATLLDETGPDPWTARGAVCWPTPNLAQLDTLLGPGGTLLLCADALDAETADDEARDWLLRRLVEGTRIELFLRRLPRTPLKGSTARERQTLLHLQPWLADGRLRIAELPQDADLQTLPRLCRPEAGAAAAILTAQPEQPLLDTLLPEPVYRQPVDAGLQSTLQTLRRQSRFCSADRFQALLPIERWAYEAHQARDFKALFAVLAGHRIGVLRIHDPYCAAEQRQLEALAACVNRVRDCSDGIDRLEVVCRELNRHDERHRGTEATRQAALQALRPVLPGAPLDVKVESYRGGKRSHDRWLDAVCIDDSGIRITVRYDLSGGIDYLMDPARATKVYRYLIED